MGNGRVVVSWLHPGHVAGSFMSSMFALLAFDTHEDSGRVFFGGGNIAMQSGANVTSARNKVVTQFLDSHSAEWLWMVDSDMTFEPDCLARLVDAADPVERPIVGGLCFGVWQANEPEVFTTLYHFDETGDAHRLLDYPQDAVMRIGATGAACLLVHRSVLEKMRERYELPWPWFAETVMNGKPYGEDITFCLRAAACGFPTYVHTGVKLGHVKEWVVDETAFTEWKANREA